MLAFFFFVLVAWLIYKVLSGAWGSSTNWPSLPDLGSWYKRWVPGQGGLDENIRNFPMYMWGDADQQAFDADPSPWNPVAPTQPTAEDVANVDNFMNQWQVDTSNNDLGSGITNWALDNRLF